MRKAKVQMSVGIRAVWTFCSSTYTTVSIDSVSGKRRPLPACAYAQADQGLQIA